MGDSLFRSAHVSLARETKLFAAETYPEGRDGLLLGLQVEYSSFTEVGYHKQSVVCRAKNF